MKIKLSDNKELVTQIKQKINENGGYCPCRLTQNEDTKCPCREFRNQIDERRAGECHCGLYTISLEDERE